MSALETAINLMSGNTESIDYTPTILVKSIYDEEQLRAKLSLGVGNFEVQIVDDDNIIKYYEVYRKLGVHVSMVHTVIQGEETVNLEECRNKKSYDRLYNAVLLADMFAKAQGDKVGVVIHNSWNVKTYEIRRDDLIYIANMVREFDKRFPNVFLAIENVCPFGTVAYSIDDTVKVCLLIKSLSKAQNIGVTFDLCHHQMAERYEDDIAAYYNKYGQEYTRTASTVLEAFDRYGSLIKNIHFNKAIGLGNNNETHSQPYSRNSETDVKYVRAIFEKLKARNLHPYITLEIYEKDYTKPVNTEETLDLIKYVLGD